MLYGLYLSAQGAQARSTQLGVVANNLANAGTNAFKRDLALLQSHPPFDHGRGGAIAPPGNLNDLAGGATVAATVTDHSPGPLTRTGGDLDVAIAGPGFFRVTDGRETLLTRDGRFTRNPAGELVTADGGLPVLADDGGPILLAADAVDTAIGPDGIVSQLLPTGETVVAGRIDVVVPQAIEKLGHGLYRPAGEVAGAGPETRLAQGFVEGSGVNPVLETLQMIEASRAFETNVNMIRFQDESLGRLLAGARP